MTAKYVAAPPMMAGPNDTMEFADWYSAHCARVKAWEEKGGGAIAFPLSFYGNELLGEIGEACNVIKKLHRQEAGAPGSRDTIEHLGEEIADGIICSRNLCIKLGYGSDIFLPEDVSITQTFENLSDYGNFLGAVVGRICGYISFHDDPERIGLQLSVLVTVLKRLAEFAGIPNIEEVTIKKWNETSIKNGFPHRIKLTYSLEETFK